MPPSSMEDGLRDLNVQFVAYIDDLFRENPTEDLSDRLRALVEEYERHVESLAEEITGGAKVDGEDDEDTKVGAHDADEEGDDEADGGGNGGEDVGGDEPPETNYFGESPAALSPCVY